DSRLPSPSQEEPTGGGIGFQRRPQPAFGEGAPYPQPPTEQPRRPIGFFTDREPDKPQARAGADTVPAPTVSEKNTVEQCTTAEQPGTAPAVGQATSAETVSLLADIKEWKKRCTQCFHRALNQQREEFREHNRRRTDCYAAMLRALGFRVTYNFESMFINIIEPTTYTIGEDASNEILKQKSELEKIGKA